MQFDMVFYSDLKRAIDSADLAFSSKYTIVQDSRLREANYGDLNQHHESQFNPDQYWCITNKFPHGESYKDVEERISDFIDFEKVNYANTHVAVVAHKAPQLAFDLLLNKKSWEQDKESTFYSSKMLRSAGNCCTNERDTRIMKTIGLLGDMSWESTLD